MRVISIAKVITRAERSNRPKSKQPGNREQVTAIDYIISSGQALLPVIIYEGKVYQSTQYIDIEQPRDQSLRVSDNGQIDDRLGLTWLEYIFQKYTVLRTKGVYRLLILDSYSSYRTPEFDLFYKEHLIIILCILLYSSYLLQLLDIGCFTVLKRSYRQQIEGYIYNRVNYIDKDDFLKVYYTVYIESISLANIQSSFVTIGLVLYNPERVLSKLYT